MSNISGLQLVVPSSVTASSGSASASETGKITFSGTESFSINGCFSSSYDNYLIVMRFNSVASVSSWYFRMRASGSDAISNYNWQREDANSTTISASRTTSTTQAYFFAPSTSYPGGAHLYIFRPFLAQATAYRSLNTRGDLITDSAGSHTTASSYDGINITDLSGGSAITGALTVYGLSQ